MTCKSSIYQIEYLSINQLKKKKLLIWFYRDKTHPLSSLLVVHCLDIKKGLFHNKKEDNKEIIGLEVLYLSAIDSLMHLVNYMRSNITFSTSLLVRYSSTPTYRYWNDVKQTFHYLYETTYKRLLYLKI